MGKFLLATAISLMVGSIGHADVLDDLDSCKYSCSQSCENLKAQLEYKLRDYQRSCGTNPAPRPPRDGGVEIYHSDSCSSNLIASVSEYTNCDALESSGTAAWGIKINGVCHNISDMSVAKACQTFGAGSSRETIEVYHSDSCSSNLLAFFSPETNCEAQPDTGSDAWAIKVGGVCKNISDMSLKNACVQFASANSRRAVKIYRSDSCSTNLVATVTRRTDCSSLPATGSDAWGVEINGQCQNISDTNVRAACESFKGSGLR